MRGRHHYRRHDKEPADLDMTTFLNLMVVLVPFLLITAVFSRITIVELSLPTSTGGAAPVTANRRVEVIVRSNGLEISDGRAVLDRLPMVDGEYDLARLSDRVWELKQEDPEKNDASVLLEPDIEYDHLIQVMDVVRSTKREGSEEGQFTRVALFSDIAIGDAP
jgi:biopolymer transport protein ExbD